MNRHDYLASVAVIAVPPLLSINAASEGKFFALAQHKGRWWFVTPKSLEPYAKPMAFGRQT